MAKHLNPLEKEFFIVRTNEDGEQEYVRLKAKNSK